MNLQYLSQATRWAFITSSLVSVLSMARAAGCKCAVLVARSCRVIVGAGKRAVSSIRTKYWVPDLMEGEACVHKGRVHPVMFFWAVSWLLIAWGLSVYDGNLRFLAKMVCSIAIANAVGAIVFYYCSVFSITDRRLIYRVGFISRDSRDLLLHNIDYVRVEQTVLGRLLKYGTMTVVGSANIAVKMAPLRDPIACRKKLQEQIHLKMTKERKP